MPLALKFRKALTGVSSPLGRRALRAGVAESVEHERILRLTPWRSIVDVGANRGQFSLAAHRHNPQAQIHAFEPLKDPAALFNRVLGDIPTINLHHFAVGPVAQSSEMYVSARDDSSSLLPIGEGQTSTFPGTEAVARETVLVRTLDSVISGEELHRPALLKIDVQGYELDALRGCEALLGVIDAIYIECSLEELYVGQALFGDVVEWLQGRGFRLRDIGPVHRQSGRVIQGDFLFWRS